MKCFTCGTEMKCISDEDISWAYYSKCPKCDSEAYMDKNKDGFPMKVTWNRDAKAKEGDKLCSKVVKTSEGIETHPNCFYLRNKNHCVITQGCVYQISQPLSRKREEYT